MKHLRRLLVLALVAQAALAQVQTSHAQAVTFDDSGPDIMTLSSVAYEVGLRKTNGAIAYITDRASGRRISEGSRYGCLWGAYGSQAGYVGGCSYSAAGASRFSYSWSAADARLSLRYSPDPARASGAEALVTLTASAGSWFDLQLQLQNRLDGMLEYVLFPSDLVLREADIAAAYIPFLPGVELQPAFFAQNRSYVAAYPGDMFADFTAVTAGAATLAVYALPDAAGIRPLVLGLNHDDGYVADSTYLYRAFGARAPGGAAWLSPPVRLRLARSPGEAVEAYRVDTGIDRFAPLAAKAGARYAQLVRSPLLKADASQLAIAFAQYPALLGQVEPPGLVHLLAFQPGGFDETHPDVLPPDAAWGTTADLAAMMRQAQAQGFLVMPYANPTWWDDESPTMRALIGAGRLAEVVDFDLPGVARYEVYGTHGGYVMSPYAPLVRQRLSRLVDDLTATIPGDLLFEDQVGARTWLFDHNAASPSPTAYAQGWLAHTLAYSPTLLMTENGNDRLAAAELGFHGSVLLAERLGQTDGRWGAGAWRPYPLAPLALRDKVLLYQHNLAPETFTTSARTLTWNMAFGYMLSFDLGWTNYGGGAADPWLAAVEALQHDVIARYAGERLVSYTRQSATTTVSAFEHVAVVANWSSGEPYAYGPHLLAPDGFLAASDDGSLTAGLFTAYNGAALSAGQHLLIEERAADAVTVRQPLGGDTALTVRVPPAWQTAGGPVVWAYGADGAWLGGVAGSISGADVSFVYQRRLAGADVARYRIAPGSRILLPVVQRGR